MTLSHISVMIVQQNGEQKVGISAQAVSRSSSSSGSSSSSSSSMMDEGTYHKIL